MTTNPIIPSAYDVLWIAIPIIAAVLLIAAIVTIIRAPYPTAAARVGWTAAVVLFPVIGSTIWLLHHGVVQRSRRGAAAPRRGD